MANPLETLKKLKGRSWTEIRARGEQAFSVYSEQIGLGGKLPSDAELAQLLNKTHFGKGHITPDILFDRFFELSEKTFFPSLAQKDRTVELFREKFKGKPVTDVLEKAEKIIEGRFNLLGFLNLDLGTAIDWHFEPLSGKHIPLKHWKQFDELGTEETGDKKIIWELNRHQHFFTLGVAYGLTGEERYAATFARHLDSWMEQNPPGMGINWFSSLEVALRVISWFWAFQLFKGSNSLTHELFQKALKFLYLHGRHLEKYLSTYYSPNTHLTGEALGLYYLGTQLDIFERAKHWRKLGEEILISELDRQILPDGVYFEQTTWYQRYTADFYTHFLILKSLSGEKFPRGMQKKIESKFQSMTDFLLYITRPDGTTPIIGDDDGGRSLPLGNNRADDFRGVLSTAAVLCKRGDYKFAAAAVQEETLWLLGAKGLQGYESLRSVRPEKTSAAFRDGGYFAMRDGWGGSDNYLLMDCGPLGALNGGHGHADALSFDLAVEGRTVLIDSGTYTYHESKDLRDFFRSSIAHNTLMIDDKSQSATAGKFSWKSKANTYLHSWLSQDRFDYFEGSHDGYERLSNPAKHTRSVLFLKNDYWIMRDYVETSGTHNYALNFHFNIEANPLIENLENGSWCVSETPSDDVGLRLFTFGDNGSWQRKETWVSKNYGEKVNAPILRFISKGKGIQEFFTFMIPAQPGSGAAQVLETEVAGGRAFVINYHDYHDILVFADGEQIVRTEFFNTDFRFLWTRISKSDGLPEEFVLIGGKNFSFGNREVINYPTPLKFAIARRLGDKLNVRTSESVFSVSLPRKTSSTYILKSEEQS